MLKDRDHWAEELRKQIDKHHQDIKKFVRNPDDDDCLVQAIVSSYLTGLMTQNQKRERHTISDDEEKDDRRRQNRKRASESDSENRRKRRRQESPRPTSKATFSQTPQRRIGNARETRSASHDRGTPRATSRLAALAEELKDKRGSDNVAANKDRDSRAAAAIAERREKKRTQEKSMEKEKKDAKEVNDKSNIGDPAWPIEEFNDFVLKATERMQEAQMAAMETTQFRELIDRIPLEVRKAYKLPVSVASYAIAQTQAKKTIKQIEDMVSNVTKAYSSLGPTGSSSSRGVSNQANPKKTAKQTPASSPKQEKAEKVDLAFPPTDEESEDIAAADAPLKEDSAIEKIFQVWPRENIEKKQEEVKLWLEKQGTKEGATITKIRQLFAEMPEEAKIFGKITSWEEQVKTKERIRGPQMKSILEVLTKLFTDLLSHEEETPPSEKRGASTPRDAPPSPSGSEKPTPPIMDLSPKVQEIE